MRKKPPELHCSEELINEWTEDPEDGLVCDEGVNKRHLFDRCLNANSIKESFSIISFDAQEMTPPCKPTKASLKKISNGNYFENKENYNTPSTYNMSREIGEAKEKKLGLSQNNIKSGLMSLKSPTTMGSTNNAIRKKKNISREVLESVKGFSDNFFHNTKMFINSQLNGLTDRTQCSCSARLQKNQTCDRALKWFSYKYKTKEIPNLKMLYDKLQNAEEDPVCVSQIRKDLPRTFPNYRFFREGSSG